MASSIESRGGETPLWVWVAALGLAGRKRKKSCSPPGVLPMIGVSSFSSFYKHNAAPAA